MDLDDTQSLDSFDSDGSGAVSIASGGSVVIDPDPEMDPLDVSLLDDDENEDDPTLNTVEILNVDLPQLAGSVPVLETILSIGGRHPGDSPDVTSETPISLQIESNFPSNGLDDDEPDENPIRVIHRHQHPQSVPVSVLSPEYPEMESV